MIEEELNIYLYNIGKASSPSKISSFLTSIRKSKPHIIGLTEFDLHNIPPSTARTIVKLFNDAEYNLTFSNPSSRVQIFISNSIASTIISNNRISNTLPPPFNQYVSDIEITFDKKTLHILLLYIPTNVISSLTTISASSFFDKFIPIINNNQLQNPIFMGDWNSAPDAPELKFLKLLGCYDIISRAPKKFRNSPTNTNHINSRRIDRFYLHQQLIISHKFRYKIHEKPTSSSHFPVTLAIKARSRRKQKKRNSNFPPQHYIQRKSPTPNHLLDNDDFIRLAFSPTPIWTDDIKLSFEYYTVTISERTKNLNHLFKLTKDSPTEEDMSNNYKQAHGGNFLSPTFEELNKRFTKFLDQTTFNNNTISSANHFFSDLYSDKEDLEPNAITNFINNSFNYNLSNSLSTDDKTQLIKPITPLEVFQTLKLLSSKGPSSPGNDGITYKAWYKAWDYAKDHLVEFANYLLHDASYHHSPIFDVLIKLIPKKGFNQNNPQVSQLRPISLTNTSYRLFNYILTQRSMPIFDKIVSRFQQAFIKGRDIHLHIQSARIISNFIVEHNTTNSMLLLDIAKAFDTLSLNYMKVILERAGFPDTYIRSVIIQNSCGKAYLLNGNQQNLYPIHLKRGVRQGLPISPLIFNLSIEPLLYRLQRELNGILYNPLDIPAHTSSPLTLSIPLSSSSTSSPSSTSSTSSTSSSSSSASSSTSYSSLTTRVKVQAFADDLIIFSQNIDDIQHAISLCNQFGTISGLKLNKSKTKIYAVDNQVDEMQHILQEDIEVVPISTNPIYLGIPVLGTNWSDTFESLLKRTSRILFMDLKLHTIILGINTYIFSTIFYRDQHDPAPSQLLSNFISDIKRLIIQSVYPKPNMKRDLWYIPRYQGELGLMDLHTQVLGRRAYYIHTTLHPEMISHPYLTKLLRLELQLVMHTGKHILSSLDRAFHIVDASITPTREQYLGPNPIIIPNAFLSQPVVTLPWFMALAQIKVKDRDFSEFKCDPQQPQDFLINFSQRWRNLTQEARASRNRAIEAAYLSQSLIPPPLGPDYVPRDLTLHTDTLVRLQFHHFGKPYPNAAAYIAAWTTLTIPLPIFLHRAEYSFADTDALINNPEQLPGFRRIAHNHLKSIYSPASSQDPPSQHIQPHNLKRMSFIYHSRQDYYSKTTKTWLNWRGKSIDQWKDLFRKISKYHLVFNTDTSFFYGLQVGLYNTTFFNPCSLCHINTREQGLSPLRHTFSNCEIASLIFHFVKKVYQQQHPHKDIHEASFNEIICPQIINIDYISFYDRFIGFLIYCARSGYAKIKNLETPFSWTEEELQELHFFYMHR